jgi:lysophospholipase L1-like esterase
MALGNKNILCYGDSLTAGYSHDGTVFTPYSIEIDIACSGTVDTNGMSGWTTEDMLQQMDSTYCSDFCGRDGQGLRTLVNKKPYDWVLLLAGTNDLGTDVEADEAFSNICGLIDVCVEAGVKSIGVMTVPACGIEWKLKYLQEERAKLNQFILNLPNIDKYAAGTGCCNSVIVPIEITGILPNGEEHTFDDPNVAALWDSDHLHFSEQGSRRLGQHLVSAILQVGGAV